MLGPLHGEKRTNFKTKLEVERWEVKNEKSSILRLIMLLKRWNFINGLPVLMGKQTNAKVSVVSHIYVLVPLTVAKGVKFKTKLWEKIQSRQFGGQ